MFFGVGNSGFDLVIMGLMSSFRLQVDIISRSSGHSGPRGNLICLFFYQITFT